MKLKVGYSFYFLVTIFLCSCNKEKMDGHLFIVQGKITHSDTQQGISGVWVYTDYGEPCCAGLAKKLGSDSVRTDAQGQYRLQLTYPEDTVIYRFITYLKAIPLANKFYYYFGQEIQDIGVTQFSYAEMVVPEMMVKLPDGYTHTCNFSVLPIGILKISFKQPATPVEDTVFISAKRLDKNEMYIEVSFFPSNFIGSHNFPIPGGVNTEITQDIIYAGIKRTKKDTFKLSTGQHINWVIEH